MIERFNTLIIINGVTDSYETNVDEDSNQLSYLICSGLLPASVLLCIGLVGSSHYMLVRIAIGMGYNIIDELNIKKKD